MHRSVNASEKRTLLKSSEDKNRISEVDYKDTVWRHAVSFFEDCESVVVHGK